MMIYLRPKMTDTERRFLQIIVEFDALRLRLVDLAHTFREEVGREKREAEQHGREVERASRPVRKRKPKR